MKKSTMNKAALSLALGSLLITSQASADTLLGLYLGGDGWRSEVSGSFGNSEPAPTFNFDSKNQGSYFIALEHPIPVLPNIRLAHNQLQAEGVTLIDGQFSFAGEAFTVNTSVRNQVDLTNTDVVLYYEILDNSVVALDLGLNGKHIKGYASLEEQAEDGLQGEESVSQWLPMVYVSSKVGLPLTGLDVFAQGSYVGWSDSRMYDLQAGIGYEVVDSLTVDIRLKVGYRAVNLRLDDLDNLYSNLDFKGVFAGVELHF
ncbi:TIGR04219 family outer membrane beta-barrel protein [Arsukibacterium sp. UBA3155]|uniref:TIGR04219 family outer membrane beta-barrel protein n=1 Tax=Arsukibacterium sp. UBA3155 TaxID=1946058 RepID=UPI0025B80108|nr:TIGR04219 family outer membrane beta-barrel protein [Arsukibacterium sp. UBA3155]|tara:strand:+ start:59469 stop:60242 length:774 start_codon:yes stop_codon:yes gene_type:complete